MVRALDMQSKGPEFEGAIYMYMIVYVTKFALFFLKVKLFLISWIPKLMVQFQLGIKTVARIEMD